MKKFYQGEIDRLCRQLTVLENDYGLVKLACPGRPEARLHRRINKEFVALMLREQRYITAQVSRLFE